LYIMGRESSFGRVFSFSGPLRGNLGSLSKKSGSASQEPEGDAGFGFPIAKARSPGF
jgi:hypothetical protein